MLHSYQQQVQRTRNYQGSELPNYTLGLVCEAGEFGDHIKKHVYHGHPLDKTYCKQELGDVLWYLANICNVLGLDLNEVAYANLKKLEARYPHGFSREASQNREV